MRIAPAARLDDGRLDLVVLEAMPVLELLALVPLVYRGAHVRHPAVHSFRVRWARLAADRPLTIYADGEPLGPLDAEGTTIEVWPGALRVVV
jgi:diacylglycerol kinase family enzyme